MIFPGSQDLADKPSKEVSKVNKWANYNKLQLNAGKTKILLVRGKRLNTIPTLDIDINATELTQVNHAKLLGMEVDDDLSFDHHVNNISKKISKNIGILKNINSYLPIPKRILYYNAMIKPLFMYCNVVWSICSNDILKLFKLQKRPARIILNAEPRHPSIDAFSKLNWLPFYVE